MSEQPSRELREANRLIVVAANRLQDIDPNFHLYADGIGVSSYRLLAKVVAAAKRERARHEQIGPIKLLDEMSELEP